MIQFGGKLYRKNTWGNYPTLLTMISYVWEENIAYFELWHLWIFYNKQKKNGEDESEMENNVEMVTFINVLRIKCRDNAIINEF